MNRKLTGKALAEFEAKRDIWQEVTDSIREIEAGRGKRTRVEPRSPVLKARIQSGLTQAQFAALLGVSKRTLEQRDNEGALQAARQKRSYEWLSCTPKCCEK